MNKNNHKQFLTSLMFLLVQWLCSTEGLAADAKHLIGLDLDRNRELLESAMQGRNYVVQVDSVGRIKQIIDTGASGDGRDPKRLIDGQIKNAVEDKAIDLPSHYQGQQAIDHLGLNLPDVAAVHGLVPEKLKELLLDDDTVRVDANNQLFYVDKGHDELGEPDLEAASNAGGSQANGESPKVSSRQLSRAFKLHSKPGADKSIYLNFVGYAASMTAWSRSSLSAAPYDLDGNPSRFDDNERRNIIGIWKRVSEDYAPFDVDVTTEPPSEKALVRSSAADASYGTQVVITRSDLFKCKCGGLAYVGVVSMIDNAYYQPAWIFQKALASKEKYIAEAISHEAGHTLGLFHDGGSGTAYYSGHGSGKTSWAPIMGVGYFKNVTQWSKGEYPGANNQQDDIAVMASKGIMPRVDDFGNTFASALSLTNKGKGSAADIQVQGVIESSDDVDMFVLDSTGGAIKLAVNPVDGGADLDAKLTLYDAKHAVVASSAPEASLSASIDIKLVAGTYFLAVSNSGHEKSDSDYGYSTYGSLGQYRITGTYPVASDAVAPVAAPAASATSGPAALTVDFSANNSIAIGNIVGYEWSFGDGASSTSSNPTHTYTTVGKHEATLTITDDNQRTDIKKIAIVVQQPPTSASLQAKSIGMKLTKSRGKVKATVAVKVVDAEGRAIPNAVVTGTWSGSFKGTGSGKTNRVGVSTQSTSTAMTKGGTAVYRLDNIALPDHSYNPAGNSQSVVTSTW